MIATDIAIEIFFATGGACARAAPLATIDADASMATLTKRIFISQASFFVCALLNPPVEGLVPPGRTKFARTIAAPAKVATGIFSAARAGLLPAAPARRRYPARH